MFHLHSHLYSPHDCMHPSQQNARMYAQCVYLLKKTQNEDYIARIEEQLNRDSDDFKFAFAEIEDALLFIPPEQLCYYTPILLGHLSFEQHFEQNLIEGKMVARRKNEIVMLTTPFIAAGVSTVLILAKFMRLAHLQRDHLIRHGFHSFTHCRGIMRGFWQLIDVFFYIEYFK